MFDGWMSKYCLKLENILPWKRETTYDHKTTYDLYLNSLFI